MTRFAASQTPFGNPGDQSLVANDGSNDVEVLRGASTAVSAFVPVITKGYLVAALPAAAAGLKGARAHVTDANATFTAGIGDTVVGGGANCVPVFCDGTAWKIG